TAAHPYRGVVGAHVALMLSDPADAERIYAALADGGRVQMPLQETFWALSYGIVTDRFGVPWMINCVRAGIGCPE
ncbi:MAG: VOC family protein, partial [Lysobacter sp.]|nr:VOC family protein [Lysobacter sp.]